MDTWVYDTSLVGYYLESLLIIRYLDPQGFVLVSDTVSVYRAP